MENQLVVFTLADEDYGVDISAVDGIVEMQAVTTVPQAPGFVEGVISLRGEVLPVIDLRKRFGLPAEKTTKETRIVHIELDGTKVGMVVDAVTEVLRISEENVEAPSPLVTPVSSGFITGIAKVDDGEGDPGRLIILLDLAKVLSSEEQSELQTMRQEENGASSDQ